MDDTEITDIRNNKVTDKLFALVTGGSRGLGREFVIELARKNLNILIVALPDDGLPQLCHYIRINYSIECFYLEIDLTRSDSIDELVKWASGYRINILINNAGMGGSREFILAETEYLDSMIALNVRALTLITHKLLPELKSHKQSYILNVASMASFSPIGYKTIYPASKVFVLYFTRGLHQELKGTGVNVSVVHPGPMKTNSQVTKRIEKLGMFGKIGLLTPEYVAVRSIDLLFKGKSIIILGWLNHLTWLIMKTVPLSIRLPLISKIMKKAISGSKKQPI
ncbi:MAG: SDR family NAD(P)-dependent oxidoreductase [Bacteroidales bacterium]